MITSIKNGGEKAIGYVRLADLNSELCTLTVKAIWFVDCIYFHLNVAADFVSGGVHCFSIGVHCGP